MKMEKELFYEHLRELRDHFGEEKVLLNMTEIEKYCHLDRRTLLSDRSFPAKKIGNRFMVPVVSFARWLS